MARPNPLRVLMSTPLPSLTLQRRKCYRPSLREVYRIYRLLNHHVFQNTLIRPRITLGRPRDAWALCWGLFEPSDTGAYCEFHLSDKWYCVQWLVATLAHEMVHQYQWEVEGWDLLREGKDSYMNHGPSFHAWREHLAYYHIPLHVSYGPARWFEQQSFHVA